jgi:hypothetical protein
MTREAGIKTTKKANEIVDNSFAENLEKSGFLKNYGAGNCRIDDLENLTMLHPTGLINGHYECRSFTESLPILKEFLALEVIGENGGAKIVKHPNTGWQIIAHENGADAPIKSMRNHYGVRVTTNSKSTARRNIWKAAKAGSASK